MLVDSITNDANLNRLNSQNSALIASLDVTGHEHITILKVLAWLEAFKIDIGSKTDMHNQNINMFTQIGFFTFMDIFLLMTIKLDSYNFVYDYYFDVYDAQPFREHLFNSNRSTGEINTILQSLGYDEHTPIINNYDNVMEFKGNTIKPLLLTFGRTIHEWEQSLDAINTWFRHRDE